MAAQEEVLAVVRQFNENPDVHGILVQLPLPKHIDEQAVLGAISVEKDVDGFHPLNIGRLAMKVCVAWCACDEKLAHACKHTCKAQAACLPLTPPCCLGYGTYAASC